MNRFVIEKVKTGFKFSLLAADGEMLAVSEVYPTRQGCLDGINCVRQAAAHAPLADQTVAHVRLVTAPRFEIDVDRTGQFRLCFFSTGGRLFGAIGYRAKVSCLHAIAAIREAAPDAEMSAEK